ncbi:MAG: hypothetical protein LBT53_00120 [Puniceicoccales bacterium]|jgi:enamine deaminase RidA (YjgF/YER057c/UK114 family)|nr:hypothetical protein [Puniceicoccales bacterium]
MSEDFSQEQQTPALPNNTSVPNPPVPSAAPAVCAPATTAEGVFVAPLGGGLVSFSATALPGETAAALLARLTREALRRSLGVVQSNVFGDPRLAGSFPAPEFPVALLGRHDTPAGDLRGGRVLALPQGAFERLRGENGEALGAVWATEKARYLLLGALTPEDVSATPDAQSAALWRRLKSLLESRGFALTDVVRTWFFNNHILDWYDGFNRERTAFFNENNIFGTLVPASTGVGASNAAGAGLSLDALAVSPLAGGVHVEAVASPLQCPANDYRSAFSRAVEISGDGGRHLSVSGTASIEPEGATAHKDNLDAQITLSLQVVAAILSSRGFTWCDVSRAILYFPDISWMSHFEACRAALGLPLLPAIFAHCDICRDDLLFEIELDAFKKG